MLKVNDGAQLQEQTTTDLGSPVLFHIVVICGLFLYSNRIIFPTKSLQSYTI